MVTFIASNGPDNFTSDADEIFGRKGNDTILATNPTVAIVHGGEGDDVLRYQSGGPAGAYYGSASLFGGDGNDLLVGSVQQDFLSGDNGADTLDGGGGYAHDVLQGGRGADLLIGGPGLAFASYEGASAPVRADLTAPATNTGEAAGDTYVNIGGLIGSKFADTLIGGAESIGIYGGGGNDLIIGAGALSGGDGNDRLIGSDGRDGLVGGAGDDTLSGGGGDDDFDAGTRFGEPSAGHDSFDGGAGSDTVYYTYGQAVRADLSNSATNTGDAQGDVFVSIENLAGSAFNDVLKGDNGANALYGDHGNDALIGGGGADTLTGGQNDDTIQGQGGNDRVEGGQGDDLLSSGHGGRDLFVTHEYRDREPGIDATWGHDTITDFEDGVDLIDFRDSSEFGAQVTFAALKITQDGRDTLIAFSSEEGEESIRLLNINAAQITAADFLF